MKTISLDEHSGEWLADRAEWERSEASDNAEQIARLRRNLRIAREHALTPRQREMLTLYYDRGLTMGQIAAKLSVNPSTVSRTLARAKARLQQCLRYSF